MFCATAEAVRLFRKPSGMVFGTADSNSAVQQQEQQRNESCTDNASTEFFPVNGETYTTESFLERGLKEERFRIDRKKFEDMIQAQQGHMQYQEQQRNESCTDDTSTAFFPVNGETYTTESLLERGLKEERFRIDRKKLEDMIQAQQGVPNGLTETADGFFQRVMTETSTTVSWPSKLKIGAKSKKDPHVKIIGKPEDVQIAKQMILQVLDTKKNRVTLKMDVSHSDHSYIIGKGGFKIQQVMEETGCHIHFPDSNRNSNVEKSNQVSIAGEADGVEVARSKIRELLPIVYMFELPAGTSAKPGDETGPALQHIQQTYSFNVAFKLLMPGRVLVVVRGCQRLLSRLRQGLLLLMEYLTGSKTIPVMGFMKTEIAAQHHSFVMGAGGSNVQMIMSKTGATIAFPDPSAPANSTFMLGTSLIQSFRPANQLGLGTIPGPQLLQTKSSVVLQGSFDSVCLAWQELLKCLPLVLMFDLKEGQDVDSVLINNLMETHNINIMVRPKIRENIKSVILRGAEKDSRILFQVRKEILGLQDSSACNHDLDSTVAAGVGLGYIQEEVPVVQSVPNAGSAVSPDHGLGYDLSTVESLTALSNLIQRNPKIIGLLSSLTSCVPSGSVGVNYPMDRSQDGLSAQGGWHNKMRQAANRCYPTYDLPPFLPPPSPKHVISSSSSVSQDDSDSGIFFSSRNKLRNCSSQPESSASSTSSLCNEDTRDVGNSLYSDNFQHKERSDVDLATLLADYENKKIGATKAMQQEIGDGVRTPSTLWSGMGFSKSMPGFALQGKLPVHAVDKSEADESKLHQTRSKVNENLSDQACASSSLSSSNSNPIDQVPSPFSLSNFWEHFPQQQSSAVGYGSIRTLQQLFNVFELEQYTDLFSHHEIDLHTFLTLTDIDLQQLNISYAARRKMLSAIAAMREPKKMDLSLRHFKAAPGAERRPLFSRHATSSVSEEK